MDVSNEQDISKIIDSVFRKSKVSILNKDQTFPVDLIISDDNSTIKCKLEGVDFREKYVVLMAKKGDTSFFCTLEKLKTEDGFNILKPVRVNVKQNVASPTTNIENRRIFTTNIINQNDIIKILSDDYVQKVIKDNSQRLKHIFDYFHINITERQDNRMRLMSAVDRPIFIPDKTEPTKTPEGFIPYYEYIATVKKDKESEKYRSEICIPLKYRETISIGYVQVLHSKKVDLNSFNLVNLIASSLKKEISDFSSYEESKEICKVSYLTTSEITFYHPPTRQYTKVFYLGDDIIFELTYDLDKKMVMRATINSIQATEKHYKIECNFRGLNLKQFEFLEELVQKINS